MPAAFSEMTYSGFVYGNRLLAGPTSSTPRQTNAYRKIKNQPVILSAVELFSSEERGKSAKRYSGLRDLVTTLGGFFDGM